MLNLLFKARVELLISTDRLEKFSGSRMREISNKAFRRASFFSVRLLDLEHILLILGDYLFC